jgi:hypothetical protein
MGKVSYQEAGGREDIAGMGSFPDAPISLSRFNVILDGRRSSEYSVDSVHNKRTGGPGIFSLYTDLNLRLWGNPTIDLYDSMVG